MAFGPVLYQLPPRWPLNLDRLREFLKALPRTRRHAFIYIRLHGVEKYGGRYNEAALDGWAEWLAARAREGRPVFAYFNNDTGGHAPRDA